MCRLSKAGLAVFACVQIVAGLAGQAMAQAPRPWQMNLQDAHSPVKVAIDNLNNIVSGLMVLVVVLVFGLMLWVIVRYNRRANPVPARFSHHTTIEILWTLVPVLILVGIAIPSFRLVYYEDRTREADLTINVTGHQWYWEYAYPDQKNIDISSYVIPADQLKPGQPRLLSVDNPMVVPAGKNVRILTTSADVIHSFFVPSLGVQRYAIPGRTVETWFKADQPGTYYGECNQICGVNHSQMPIVIKAVSPEEFTAWAASGGKTAVAAAATNLQLAQAGN